MIVYCNDVRTEVPDEELTIEAFLVARYGASPKGVAVAINDSVVPRGEWQRHIIRDGDSILLVTAVQGG